MATVTPSPLQQVEAVCITCVRGAQAFAGNYRAFLLNPGTLFTALSLVLLLIGGIQHPGGLLGSDRASQVRTPLYLASALVGSTYIWWSAIQGIGKRDFTADIPVSLATFASIAIGQYSAA